MRAAIFNIGVVHAKNRTIAISRYMEHVYYIDMKGIDKTEYFEGTNITYICPFPDGKMKFGDIRILKLLKKIEPDIIICHYAGGIPLYDSVIYGKCAIAVLAMGHDVLYDKGDEKIPGYDKLLKRLAFRRVDYFSAKSIIIKRKLLQLGVKCPIDVNYWGANPQVFYPIAKREARKALGLDQNTQIILSPRAIEPRLNIHIILEAYNELKNEKHNVILLVIGRVWKKYKETLDDYCTKNNLLTKVRFIEHCSQENLNLYMNAADVIVSMGSSEGFPNTVLEAMFCKKIIIVGRIRQIEEILINKKNAIICEINTKSLIEAIKDVFSNYNDYKNTIASGAFETACNLADLQTNAESFTNKIKQISKKRIFFELNERYLFILVYIIIKLYSRILIMISKNVQGRS